MPSKESLRNIEKEPVLYLLFFLFSKLINVLCMNICFKKENSLIINCKDYIYPIDPFNVYKSGLNASLKEKVSGKFLVETHVRFQENPNKTLAPLMTCQNAINIAIYLSILLKDWQILKFHMTTQEEKKM